MIVCAATNNAGKLKELRRILTRCGHEVKSLRELGVTLDPEETGTTFAENAKIKAEAFCKATGLPTVADDSGLCVDALNGAPGVYSARYAGEHGNDAANNEKLMAEMQNVPVGQRAALRGMANTMEPVFQIGKGEIDETLIKGVDDCIKARELIKLKVLENSEYDAREAADILCEAIHAECVQVIGRKFVLFRKKPKESAYAELLKK